MTDDELKSYKDRSFDSLTTQDIWKLTHLGVLNGCGGAGTIIKPPCSVFYNANCNKHDFGYWKGGDGARRKECDIKFLRAMMSDIEFSRKLGKNGVVMLSIYTIWAGLYYIAVRMFGWIYFTYK